MAVILMVNGVCACAIYQNSAHRESRYLSKSGWVIVTLIYGVIAIIAHSIVHDGSKATDELDEVEE